MHQKIFVSLSRKNPIAVIPVEGSSPACQTSRTPWPQKGQQHRPLLAVGKTSTGAVIVLVPRNCGGDGRSPKIFSSNLLVPYAGTETVEAITREETAEVKTFMETSSKFRQNTTRAMDVRRATYQVPTRKTKPVAAIA